MSWLLFTKFSFIQLSCDNARVFQRVCRNLNMTVGQAVCQLLCRYTQSTLAVSCVCWIVPIATCTLSKELVAVHVWNAPDQWYTILLVWVDCCFLRFSECFPVISGFCIAVHYRVYYCFSTIFWVLASGLPSAKFLPDSNLQLRHCTWSNQGCTADKSYV